MNTPQTIVVTGGAGYIGSHTIIELLENTNFNVISIDNFSNSSEKTYKRIEIITNKKIESYAIDLCNYKDLEDVLSKQNNIVGIIHFAAFKSVPESVDNPHKYYHNNINSLLNILEYCKKYSINNFIFSSSCSVYGNIENLPVDENTALNKPQSPYAYTKQIGEEILSNYSTAFPKMQFIALRYFNPVGAHISGLIGEDPINKPSNLVPIITQTAIGKINQMIVHGNDYNTRDGSCIRDYIHVTDIATAHIKALHLLIDKKNKTNFSIYNLGTGNGISVFEAIQSFEKISTIKLKYIIGPKRTGDVEAIFSDTQKSYQELNWKPKFSLDEMMKTAWAWEQNLKM